jgi:hypothetical protein
MHGREEEEVLPERTVFVQPHLLMPDAPDLAPGAPGDSDVDIEMEEIELDDSEIVESPSSEIAVPAVVKANTRPPEPPKSRPPPPKSRPPEPPKSKPPDAPGKGFLNRLLNRKG